MNFPRAGSCNGVSIYALTVWKPLIFPLKLQTVKLLLRDLQHPSGGSTSESSGLTEVFGVLSWCSGFRFELLGFCLVWYLEFPNFTHKSVTLGRGSGQAQCHGFRGFVGQPKSWVSQVNTNKHWFQPSPWFLRWWRNGFRNHPRHF